MSVWSAAEMIARLEASTAEAEGARRGIESIARKVADEVKKDPRTVAYYKAHPDGRCDFVVVEESVSAYLSQAGIDQDRFHPPTCGLVFAWLSLEYGVSAPEWFHCWEGGR